jgi:hypothetical protein
MHIVSMINAVGDTGSYCFDNKTSAEHVAGIYSEHGWDVVITESSEPDAHVDAYWAAMYAAMEDEHYARQEYGNECPF